MPAPTSFDGFAINAATAYGMQFHQEDFTSAPYVAETTLRGHVSTVPVQEAISYKERQLSFRIVRRSGTRADFVTNVNRYFTPFAGLRALNATHDDGTTPMTAQADVVSLQKIHPDAFDGTFLLPDAIWRATSTSSDSSSPLTAGGNYKALPSIAITPTTTTLKRRRITITDGGTKGLINYPVRIEFDATGVSATASTDYIVFYKGQQVPFMSGNLNASTTYLWVRVDVPPAGTTTLDIYYGSSIANTVTNDKLNDGGLNLATSTNTTWKWTLSPFDQANMGLGIPGSWTPAKTGNQGSASWGRSQTDTKILQTLPDSGQAPLPSDYDSYVLLVGTVGGSLTNLSRVVAEVAGGPIKAFVRYRLVNQTNWVEAWSVTFTNTVTSAVTVTGAVEIAIGLENGGGTATTVSTMTLNDTGTALQLTLTGEPSVSVAAAVTSRTLNSSLISETNGDVVIFNDLYLDDVVMTIDCLGKTITVASGPWYGSVTFPDPDDWYALVVGSNAWTNATNATAAFTWRDRYLL